MSNFAIDFIDVDALPAMLAEIKTRRNSTIERRLSHAIELVGADPIAITGSSRRKDRVAQRWVIFWLLHQCGWSYPQMARALGRCDHTTAMHGVRQVVEKLALHAKGRAA